MNKKTLSVIGFLLTVCIISSSCTSASTGISESTYSKAASFYSTTQRAGSLTAEPAESLTLACENEYLALYYNKDTAAVDLFDKRTGEWWKTNPDDTDGTLSSDAMSQICLSTISSKGVKSDYNTYSDAISYGQAEYTVTGNSLLVTYTIGHNTVDLSSIPSKLTNERYEALLARMDTDGQKLMPRRYTYEGDTNIWTRKSGLTNDQSQKLIELFNSISYSEAELEQDNAACGVQTEASDSKVFVIPLKYTLDEDSFIVNIDLQSMIIPANQLITSLQLLPYLGSLKEDEDGYLFVPDGSGAIVNTAKAEGNIGSYSASVYGTDYTLPVDSSNNLSYDILLPVFGINHGSSGLLAVIEDAESLASVEVAKAGYVDDYAKVFSSYNLNASQNVGLTSDSVSKFYVTSESSYSGDIQVRYICLEAEQSDYSGMARTYRQYLTKNNPMERLEEKTEIPFYLETIGSVETEVSTAGFVHESYAALTTYKDNIALIEELKKQNITNVNLILTGWMNGGLDQKLADGVSLLSVLGGKSGFQQLEDYAAENGIGLYPQVLLNTMSLRDAQSAKNQYVSHTLAEKKSTIYNYDMVTADALSGSDSGNRLIISPAYQMTLVKDFLKNFLTYSISGVNVGDLGTTAYSDYNESSEFLRPYSVMQSAEIIKLLSDQTGEVMLSSPNNATAVQSSNYTDVPSSSSGYRIFERSVPFYQMVFHGYADYSFEAMNYDADLTLSYLKCAEYGAYPKFQFVYTMGALDVEEYSDLYASGYERWLDSAGEIYVKLNDLLAPVSNACILSDEQMEDGVFKVSYDNGYSIYVNYTAQEKMVDGYTIAAESALLKEAQS